MTWNYNGLKQYLSSSVCVLNKFLIRPTFPELNNVVTTPYELPAAELHHAVKTQENVRAFQRTVIFTHSALQCLFGCMIEGLNATTFRLQTWHVLHDNRTLLPDITSRENRRGSVRVITPPHGSDRVGSTRYCQFSNFSFENVTIHSPGVTSERGFFSLSGNLSESSSLYWTSSARHDVLGVTYNGGLDPLVANDFNFI